MPEPVISGTGLRDEYPPNPHPLASRWPYELIRRASIRDAIGFSRNLVLERK